MIARHEPMPATKHVFAKEAREMLRDRRVIVGAFVMPLLIIFLMLWLFGFLDSTLSKPKPIKVAVAGNNVLVEGLKSLESKSPVIPIQVKDEREGKELLRAGQVKLLLHENKSATEGDQIEEVVYFDEGETTSRIALGMIQELVTQTNKARVAMVLKEHGVPQASAEPLRLKVESVSTEHGMGGSMIVGMLPYFIVIWAFFGGFSVAGDLVAGEKERGTLETLLITPALRSQIALGKFLALSLVSLLSALTSLVGVLVVGALRLPMTAELFPKGQIVPLLSILVIFAILIPLVALFASVLLAVSSRSRNMREAQTKLTSVSMIVTMPAIFSQFIGFTDMGKAAWVQFTPILNSSIAIRSALLGKNDWAFHASTIAVSLALALLAFRFAVKAFDREEVLSRI